MVSVLKLGLVLQKKDRQSLQLKSHTYTLNTIFIDSHKQGFKYNLCNVNK